MRKDIHPEFKEVELVCTTCSAKYIFGSTLEHKNSVDVCSNCHPFYTGDRSKQRSTGRLDRFNRFQNKKESNN